MGEPQEKGTWDIKAKMGQRGYENLKWVNTVNGNFLIS
jgi:hypothetical protein